MNILLKRIRFIDLATPTLVVCCLILGACAAPKVKVTMLNPAEYDEASKLRRVAVLPFEGNGGKEFTAEFEATLATINVGGQPYFSVIDRTDIDRILKEQGRMHDPRFDAESAVSLGRILNADAVYAGHITQAHVGDSSYTEKRDICLSSQTQYDKKGKAVGEKCIRWGEKQISCTHRSAFFAYTPKLLEVETGRVVYNNNIDGKSESKICADDNKALPGKHEMINEVKQLALQKMKKEIAPYYLTVEIELMDKADGIVDKNDQERFKQGLEFAKNNRMDRACEMWGEVGSRSGNDVTILYNLGICSEVVGNLNEAKNLYSAADRLLVKPDEKISRALERVEKRINDKKKLEQQVAAGTT